MALLPFREMKVCQVNIKCNHRNFAYPLHVLIHIVRNTFFLQSAFLQRYEAKKAISFDSALFAAKASHIFTSNSIKILRICIFNSSHKSFSFSFQML